MLSDVLEALANACVLCILGNRARLYYVSRLLCSGSLTVSRVKSVVSERAIKMRSWRWGWLCGSGSVVIKGGAIEDSPPKQETFRRQGWTVDMHCSALLLCKNAYIDSELVQKYTSLFQYICCITRTFSTLVQKHKLMLFLYLYTSCLYIYGPLFL